MDQADPGHHDPALTPAEVGAFDESALQALAEQRLLQISETLGLDPDHFRQTHQAGGSHQTIAEQTERVVRALQEISDPIAIDRLVHLVEALTNSKAI